MIWALLTFWQSVGHITSDPLANWYSSSDLPQQHAPTPHSSFFFSLSLSLSFSLSLHMYCMSCRCVILSCLDCRRRLCLHSVTVGDKALRYPEWQGIPLPLVAGHSVSPGDRTFHCPQWQGWESSGFQPRAQSCYGMCIEGTWACQGWLSVCVCVR